MIKTVFHLLHGSKCLIWIIRIQNDKILIVGTNNLELIIQLLVADVSELYIPAVHFPSIPMARKHLPIPDLKLTIELIFDLSFRQSSAQHRGPKGLYCAVQFYVLTSTAFCQSTFQPPFVHFLTCLLNGLRVISPQHRFSYPCLAFHNLSFF